MTTTQENTAGGADGKRPYQSPTLIVYGALRELTEAGGSAINEGGGGAGQKKRL
jgi:hypothetical protein